MVDASRPSTIHVLRVRIKPRLFHRLQEIAHRESVQQGRHTTVSDLVRSALFDWLRANDGGLEAPAPRRFRESGAALPPLLPDDRDLENLPPRPVEDAALEEEAAMHEARELLRTLDDSFEVD